ncbi:MAG: lysophospholipid acyltransferase family protein [Fretibacterium sp.]|nr:lysophospholipid acyltransferase family protein [Fretibacterium sp.]
MKAPLYLLDALETLAFTDRRGKILGAALGGLFKLLAPRGKRVDENLKLVHPDQTAAWRKRMRRKLYEHLGLMVAEVLTLQKDPSQALSWIERVEGAEIMERTFSDSGGALLLGSHFGNWELMASWLGQTAKSKTGREFYALVKDPRDADVAGRIAQYRRRSGVNVLNRDTSFLELVKLLKKGFYIGTMPDISWSEGVTLPFMGKPCTMTTGPAALAILSSVPIVPIGVYRLGPFRHFLRFFPPLPMPDETDRRLRIERLTLEINKALERIIAPQPELWFWLHNRWKEYT